MNTEKKTEIPEREKKCKDRIAGHLKGRMHDLRQLWKANGLNEDDPKRREIESEIGSFNEYGLSFDYVAPKTFQGQRRGYFRYQISWGGPSDEFRFYAEKTGRNWTIDRVEYWFLDWGDGAKRLLRGANLDLMTEIFADFDDCGTLDNEHNKAMEE